MSKLPRNMLRTAKRSPRLPDLPPTKIDAGFFAGHGSGIYLPSAGDRQLTQLVFFTQHNTWREHPLERRLSRKARRKLAGVRVCSVLDVFLQDPDPSSRQRPFRISRVVSINR